MLEDATDIMQRQLGESTILVAGEQVFAVLGQRLVNVHAVAVVAHQRFGHEGGGLAIGVSDVQYYVLENLHLVGLAHQGIELSADFILAGSGHLMMVDFRHQAHFLQGQHHGRTQVVLGIHWRYREIAALDPGAVADIAIFIDLFGVPGGLVGIHFAEGTAHVCAPAHIVEDKEFRFGAEKGGVGDLGGFQIGFSPFGQGAGVAFITFHGDRLHDVAAQVQCRLIHEGIQHSGAGIRH